MKFPSIHSLVKGAGRTFYRFPVAILLAAKATLFCILWSHLRPDNDSYYWYWNVVTCCYLGMLLSVALTVWVESRAWTRGVAIGLQAGVIVLAGVLYYILPDHYQVQVLLRCLLLMLALHWLIAFIGFRSGEVNGFWLFNMQIFMRIVTSCVYTGILYIGLLLGLAAIENLFNVFINQHVYTDVGWVLAGVFNTWFFLAGFPRDFGNPATIHSYPQGLKIMTQYVLLPLVTIYLLILYAYLAKVIFTAHWPSGWVAYLVLAFSVAGILALLLIYPLRHDEGNRWISGYSRLFYYALLPLIGMLYFAILKRVAEYGITEQRYFVLLLACWLFFTALYFLFSAKKDMRIVPLSLCVLALLTCWGPWSAFGVSLYSQKARLRNLLVKNQLFSGGKIQAAGEGSAKISQRDKEAINSVIYYIVNMHGYETLQPLFAINLDSVMRRDYFTGWGTEQHRAEIIGHLIGLDHTGQDATSDVDYENREFYCYADRDNEVLTTEGAAYVIPDVSLNAGESATYLLDSENLRVRLEPLINRLDLTLKSVSGWQPQHKDTSSVDLSPVLRQVKDKEMYAGWHLPGEKMVLPITHGLIDGKVVLTRLGCKKSDTSVVAVEVQGYILVRMKP